jgi:hypothetical protein
MKSTLLYFVIFQVVLWSIFFGRGTSQQASVSSLNDTWAVQQQQAFYNSSAPTFNRLTLSPDGTFSRVSGNNTHESGNWTINNSFSHLSLHMANGVQENYQIIRLPGKADNLFVIQKQEQKMQYRLTRL